MLNIKEKVEGLGIASKKVNEIQSSLSGLTEQLSTIAANLQGLEGRMASIEDRISAQETAFEGLSASAGESLKKISDAAGLMNAETAKISEERKKFSERMLTKVADDLSKEVSDKLSRIKEDGEKYGQLAGSLSQASNEILRARNELEKFNRIGEKIRSSDFEMSALANKIEQLSIHNKSLHNQLERMQNAISHERRHQRTPPY